MHTRQSYQRDEEKMQTERQTDGRTAFQLYIVDSIDFQYNMDNKTFMQSSGINFYMYLDVYKKCIYF